MPSRIHNSLLCLALLSVPHVLCAQTPQSTFEIASIKPAPPDADQNTGSWSLPNIGRFTASHVSLVVLIRLAYGVNADEIVNKPDWLDSTLYDINARPEEGIKLSREELRPRLQDLLRQRFHLVAHTETRESRGYILAVTKTGQHLEPTKAEHFPGWRTNVSPGEMRGVNWSMAQFAKFLGEATGVPVTDSTGITGSYDIAFSYQPVSDDSPGASADNRLSLNEALQQATGLQLKPQKVATKVLIIDSVDKTPTPN